MAERNEESSSDAFLASRSQAIRDGRHLRFRDIWELMEAAGFHFHPDHPFGDEAVLERLQQTHQTLGRTRESLARSLVYQKDGSLLGHVGGLRVYRRTWMLQHLAVRPGFHRAEQIAGELTTLAVECAEALEDIEFIRVCWLTHNRWPHRLFGRMARAMAADELSGVRHVNYMRRPLAGSFAPPPPGIWRAHPIESAWLNGFLRARLEPIRLQAEELTQDELEMTRLGNAFAGHGLERSRRAFAIGPADSPLAVAIVETASPGLCLAELTNGFSVLVSDPWDPRAARARRQLISYCIEYYRASGRPSALAFVPDAEVSNYQAEGFQCLGRTAEWTFHRSMAQRWRHQFTSALERLARRRSRPAKNPEDHSGV